MKAFFKRSWDRLRSLLGRGAPRTRKVKPTPQIADLTYDLFERACVLLNVDPDAMYRGGVSITDIETPPLSTADEVFNLLVENADRFDLGKMTPDERYAILGVIVSDFFTFALRRGTSNEYIAGI